MALNLPYVMELPDSLKVDVVIYNTNPLNPLTVLGRVAECVYQGSFEWIWWATHPVYSSSDDEPMDDVDVAEDVDEDVEMEDGTTGFYPPQLDSSNFPISEPQLRTFNEAQTTSSPIASPDGLSKLIGDFPPNAAQTAACEDPPVHLAPVKSSVDAFLSSASDSASAVSLQGDLTSTTRDVSDAYSKEHVSAIEPSNATHPCVNPDVGRPLDMPEKIDVSQQAESSFIKHADSPARGCSSPTTLSNLASPSCEPSLLSLSCPTTPRPLNVSLPNDPSINHHEEQEQSLLLQLLNLPNIPVENGDNSDSEHAGPSLLPSLLDMDTAAAAHDTLAHLNGFEYRLPTPAPSPKGRPRKVYFPSESDEKPQRRKNRLSVRWADESVEDRDATSHKYSSFRQNPYPYCGPSRKPKGKDRTQARNKESEAPSPDGHDDSLPPINFHSSSTPHPQYKAPRPPSPHPRHLSPPLEDSFATESDPPNDQNEALIHDMRRNVQPKQSRKKKGNKETTSLCHRNAGIAKNRRTVTRQQRSSPCGRRPIPRTEGGSDFGTTFDSSLPNEKPRKRKGRTRVSLRTTEALHLHLPVDATPEHESSDLLGSVQSNPEPEPVSLQLPMDATPEHDLSHLLGNVQLNLEPLQLPDGATPEDELSDLLGNVQFNPGPQSVTPQLPVGATPEHESLSDLLGINAEPEYVPLQLPEGAIPEHESSVLLGNYPLNPEPESSQSAISSSRVMEVDDTVNPSGSVMTPNESSSLTQESPKIVLPKLAMEKFQAKRRAALYYLPRK